MTGRPEFDAVKALLLALRPMAPTARRAELARIEADDPALAREAASLLAHEAGAGAALATAGAAGLLPSLATGGSTEDVPDHGALPGPIGPYEPVGVLGEGGMGTVYRARQTAPLARTVALKLIRRGFDSARIVARFDAERQMLARMSHPNIARVLDAGATSDGLPYFVMELVEGPAVTALADRERLSVPARLSLFLAICRGVQHAHQRGIIHRDLKPSNILVASEDGTFVPKIIDFGIAKAVEPRPGESLHTQPGHLVGTPEYASPEQAGAVDAPVDTRTDVYALGILLYELLTGARPHAFESSSPIDVYRALQSGDVARPSARVTGTSAAPAAAARGTTPARLRRRLAGDLDNVALRALERDPALRYGSVEQLASDVERHLDGRPIEARAASWPYLATKFARRHAVPLTAAILAAVTIVGFAGYAVWQSALLARERDRALRDATTAQEVSRFLVGLFEASDPTESRGTPATVRDVLDRGASRARDLGGDPLVKARLLSTMGEVYHSLGLYDEARDQLLGAQQALEAMPSPDGESLAHALDLLGTVAHDTRDLEASEQYYARALALRRSLFGDEHRDTASSLINLAITVRARGRASEAEPLYRQALAINRRVLGDEHEEVAWNLYSLGWAVHQQGRLAEAEPLYRQAAAMQRRLLGPDHPDLAGTLNSLAGVPFQRGDFAAALVVWQEAFDIYQKVYGDHHAATARAYHNLAQAYMGLARFAEAEPLYRRAVELNREMLGPDHPRLGTSLQSHGVALWRQGRLDEADDRLQAALRIAEATAGPEARDTGGALARLARLLLARGRVDEARSLAERATAIARLHEQDWPAEAAVSYESQARVLLATGQNDAAVDVWRRTLELRERAENAGPQMEAIARAGLGHALVLTGRGDEGMRLIAAARDELADHAAPGHPDLAEIDARLAELDTAGH